jgi:polyisoprenoid-binding protein YceI
MHLAVWIRSAAALAMAAAALAARPDSFSADASASRIAIRTSKAGLLAGLAHQHLFVPDRWCAEARLDPAHPGDLEIVLEVDAASLHDQEPRLGEAARRHVDQTAAGPEVLDVARHPLVRYRGRGDQVQVDPLTGSLTGTLAGELELHGQRGPVTVKFEARPEGGAWRVDATVTFAQSRFGIKPYTTALGTIGVDDEVRLESVLLFRASAVAHRWGEGCGSRGRGG